MEYIRVGLKKSLISWKFLIYFNRKLKIYFIIKQSKNIYYKIYIEVCLILNYIIFYDLEIIICLLSTAILLSKNIYLYECNSKLKYNAFILVYMWRKFLWFLRQDV